MRWQGHAWTNPACLLGPVCRPLGPGAGSAGKMGLDDQMRRCMLLGCRPGSLARVALTLSLATVVVTYCGCCGGPGNGNEPGPNDPGDAQPGTPHLLVEPTSLEYASPAQTRTVTISNTGTGSLSWGRGSGDDWIVLQPESGLGDDTIQVTVDPPGGTGQGSFTIISNGGQQVVTVSVGPQVVASVAVTPDPAEVVTQGGTVTVTATARDALGGTVAVAPANWEWSIADPAVATVAEAADGSCTVTGVALGETAVSVVDSGSGNSATVPVTVYTPYHVERTSTGIHAGTLTWTVSAPGLTADDWEAYVASAPELPSQTDCTTEWATQGASSDEVVEGSPLARAVRRLRLQGGGREHGFTAVATYTMALWRRELKSGRPGTNEPPLSSAEIAASLVSLSTVDWDSQAFQGWLDALGLRRQQGELDVGFARRAYDVIDDHTVYEYVPSQDRRASALCQSGDPIRTDCGGHSILFTAAMRANGIPARTLWGWWAVSGENCHVKAEFFAEGAGWVPVDMTGSGFGLCGGDHIAFHIDTDVELNTDLAGPYTAGWMQQPQWWVHWTSGSGDTATTTCEWTVTDL